jgi:putative Holliday junction resolvase
MEIIKKEKAEKIVIGISEGASEQKARKFGEQLSKELRINVVYFDETLSTLKAQELSKEAGITRKKARALEDAFAASIMLQSYLENTP